MVLQSPPKAMIQLKVEKSTKSSTHVYLQRRPRAPASGARRLLRSRPEL